MKPAGGQRPIKSGAVMNGALNVQISAFDLNASCRLEMHTGATKMTSLTKRKSKLHTTNARVEFITTVTQQSDHRRHHRTTKINVSTAEKAPSLTPSN